MITEGDTIYVLQGTIDWKLVQSKMIVDEVTTWPDYPKGRARAYVGHTPDGKYRSTWHTGYVFGKRKRVVRKTPFPNVPIIE